MDERKCPCTGDQTEPDSRASHLGLGACLIHQVKGGADHLDLIDTQVTESFVVPFWRPSPAVTRVNVKSNSECDVRKTPKTVLSHLRSTLEMCVSLVLPDPQGSSRYCDSSTTRRTAAMRGLSSWSTDTHTNAHEPLHKSVRHDLRKQNSLEIHAHKN